MYVYDFVAIKLFDFDFDFELVKFLDAYTVALHLVLPTCRLFMYCVCVIYSRTLAPVATVTCWL